MGVLCIWVSVLISSLFVVAEPAVAEPAIADGKSLSSIFHIYSSGPLFNKGPSPSTVPRLNLEQSSLERIAYSEIHPWAPLDSSHVDVQDLKDSSNGPSSLLVRSLSSGSPGGGTDDFPAAPFGALPLKFHVLENSSPKDVSTLSVSDNYAEPLACTHRPCKNSYESVVAKLEAAKEKPDIVANDSDVDLQMVDKEFEENDGGLDLVPLRYLRPRIECEEGPGFDPGETLKPRNVTLSVLLAIILALGSAVFSGLTLGLMTLDIIQLEILIKSGADPGADKQAIQDGRKASRLLSIRKDGNLLLVVLLIGNVSINSAFSIITSDLTSGVVGFLLSTTVITFLGEIIPQAFCAKHPLATGYYLFPVIYIAEAVLYIIAKPTALFLDYVLGRDIGTSYNREQLKALVGHHETVVNLFNAQEAKILSGGLDIGMKRVRDAMTPLDNVYGVNYTDVLDYDLAVDIVSSGFSRIPVFNRTRPECVVGVIYTKDLALVETASLNKLSCKSLLHLFGRLTYAVDANSSLLDTLKEFKTGKSHIAVVRDVRCDSRGDPYYCHVGIITLEDIIEELIQEEIFDEFEATNENAGSDTALSAAPGITQDTFPGSPLKGGTDDVDSKRSPIASPVKRNGTDSRATATGTSLQIDGPVHSSIGELSLRRNSTTVNRSANRGSSNDSMFPSAKGGLPMRFKTIGFPEDESLRDATVTHSETELLAVPDSFVVHSQMRPRNDTVGDGTVSPVIGSPATSPGTVFHPRTVTAFKRDRELTDRQSTVPSSLSYRRTMETDVNPLGPSNAQLNDGNSHTTHGDPIMKNGDEHTLFPVPYGRSSSHNLFSPYASESNVASPFDKHLPPHTYPDEFSPCRTGPAPQEHSLSSVSAASSTVFPPTNLSQASNSSTASVDGNVLKQGRRDINARRRRASFDTRARLKLLGRPGRLDPLNTSEIRAISSFLASSVPAFAALPQEILVDLLLNHSEVIRGSAVPLFTRGIPSDCFLLVTNGRLKLFLNGHDKLDCFLGPWTVLGERALGPPEISPELHRLLRVEKDPSKREAVLNGICERWYHDHPYIPELTAWLIGSGSTSEIEQNANESRGLLISRKDYIDALKYVMSSLPKGLPRLTGPSAKVNRDRISALPERPSSARKNVSSGRFSSVVPRSERSDANTQVASSPPIAAASASGRAQELAVTQHSVKDDPTESGTPNRRRRSNTTSTRVRSKTTVPPPVAVITPVDPHVGAFHLSAEAKEDLKDAVRGAGLPKNVVGDLKLTLDELKGSLLGYYRQLYTNHNGLSIAEKLNALESAQCCEAHASVPTIRVLPRQKLPLTPSDDATPQKNPQSAVQFPSLSDDCCGPRYCTRKLRGSKQSTLQRLPPHRVDQLSYDDNGKAYTNHFRPHITLPENFVGALRPALNNTALPVPYTAGPPTVSLPDFDGTFRKQDLSKGVRGFLGDLGNTAETAAQRLDKLEHMLSNELYDPSKRNFCFEVGLRQRPSFGSNEELAVHIRQLYSALCNQAQTNERRITAMQQKINVLQMNTIPWRAMTRGDTRNAL